MSLEKQRPRATRYAVTTALLFRVQGNAVWRCGWLTDMSVTGVAWQVTDSPPRPSTVVEFILPLAGTLGPLVWGAGRVVRTAVHDAARSRRARAIAVAIEHSTLLPIPALGSRPVGGSRRVGAREPQFVRQP